MVNHGIAPQDLALIKNILGNYSNCYVFGSRIKGTYQKYSDLDICIKQPISDYEIELLNEQFTKSNIPFKIDLSIYQELDDDLQKTVDQEAVKLEKLC